MTKKILTVLLALALVFTAAPAASSDAYAAGTQVKSSQWKKLTVGKLSKKQIAHILDCLVVSYSNDKKTSTRKTWNKNIKKDWGFWVTSAAKSYHHNDEEDWRDNYVAHDIGAANRALSFCSAFRLKKNQPRRTIADNGLMGYKTTKSRVYYYAEGFGWITEARITSAVRNGSQIVISFTEESGGEKMGEYKAYLTKVRKGSYKGKYQLSKIRCTKKYRL